MFSAFTDELLDAIVEQTNRYAAQFASRQSSDNRPVWKTSVVEIKAYHKFVFWFLFDVVVTNAFILSRYAITTTPGPTSRQTLKYYRLKLAEHLIGSYCSRLSVGRRRLHPLPPQPSTASGQPQQRPLISHLTCKGKSTRCQYCGKIRRPTQRKERVWYCSRCEGQPALMGRSLCLNYVFSMVSYNELYNYTRHSILVYNALYNIQCII